MNIKKKFSALVLLTLICSFTFSNCKSKQIKAKINPSSFNTKLPYSWAQIDTIYTERPQDALKMVYANESYSIQNKDEPNIIKSVIYKYEIHKQYEESDSAFQELLEDISKKTTAAKSPQKEILHNLAANKLFEYYREQQYQIQGRTYIVNNKETDFRLWDKTKFIEEIDYHYNASLQNKEILLGTGLDKWGEILDKNLETRKLRPTVFDLLAHDAIIYYSSAVVTINKPENWFLDNNSGYSTNTEFVKIKFTTNDTLAYNFKALLLFQELTKNHLNTPDKEALADLERLRYAFIHSISKIENNDEFYINKMLNHKEVYKGYEISTMATFDLIQFLYRDAYGKNNKTKELNSIIELCKEAIYRYPESIGAKKSKAILDEILKEELEVRSEQNIIPGNPFPILIQYRNLDQAQVIIFKTDRIQNINDEAFRKKMLLEASTHLVVVYNLPKQTDYKKHSVELIMDGLTPGNYVMVVCNKLPVDSVHPISISIINSTSLSVQKTGKDSYQVINSFSGKPESNAEVILSETIWDYVQKESRKTEIARFITTVDGNFEHKRNPTENKNILVEVIKNDSYFEGQLGYGYNDYSPTEPVENITYFYTDRAIYRPGQTVYFKGIITDQKRNKKVISNFETTIKSFDANGQEIHSQILKTNDFGSFSGSFILPQGTLNGTFRIHNGTGYINFKVEEYKRPKFEVSFNKLKDAVKLNDSVIVTGNAKAYAGNSISRAKVVFSVTRSYREYWYRYNSNEKTIISDETTTDNEGNYKITFKAIEDASVSLGENGLFLFEIKATITDLNGESHEATTTVWIGKKLLKTEIVMDEQHDKNRTLKLNADIRNFNDEIIKTDFSIKIYKVVTPTVPIRNRLWDAPDTFMYSKEQWHQKLPADFWMLEDKKVDFGVMVFSEDVKAEQNAIRDIKTNGWKQGKYFIELITKDARGNIIKSNKTIEVYDSKNSAMPMALPVFVRPIKNESGKNSFEPGSMASFSIGSTYSKIIITYRVYSNEGEIEQKEIVLNNEIKTISIPIKESYRGGVGVEWQFWYNNRSYHGNEYINVPWSNKDLKLQLTHWNDKMLPGSKEKWTLKISGPKAEKVSAEIMATMYDASLDALYPHFWNQWEWDGLYQNNWYQNYGMQVSYSQYLFHKEAYNFYGELDYENYDFNGPVSYYWNFGDGRALEGSAGAYTTTASYSINIRRRYQVHIKDTVNFKSSAVYDTKNEEITNRKVVPQPRTNFNETAFFYPQLKTDEKGEVEISFTLPESLTAWKFKALAHNKLLQKGYLEETALAQKTLMITPNMPRFLRENDEMEIQTKISNLSTTALNGEATFVIQDAITGNTLKDIVVSSEKKSFNIKASGNTMVSWKIKVPKGIETISYTIMASAGAYADGEKNTIPVLSDQILITETLPLNSKAGETKTYNFTSVSQSKKEQTPYKLTLEFTSNPVWYAVQALPYMMEYPYECAEQTFNRYYGNVLAQYIANSDPIICAVFNAWKEAAKTQGNESLLSNLEKNKELKSILLQETPYVMQGKNESERKQRLALLFDENTLNQNTKLSLDKLKEMQYPDGGWGWFKGMPANDYITTYIATGIGKLRKLDVITDVEIAKKTIVLLDANLKQRYEEYKKSADKLKFVYNPNETQYFYMRSFYKDIPMTPETKIAYDSLLLETKKQWTNMSKMLQSMLAIALYRDGDKETALKIVESLKQTALQSDEMGMYWKEMNAAYYWYDSPIETQSVIIEAFDEITHDIVIVNQLKLWLLKNKQTNDWKTTKATADACYALLLNGTNLLRTDNQAEITVGGTAINSTNIPDLNKDAGTGYLKTSWSKNEIKPTMADIKITIPGSSSTGNVAYGALYYQYFTPMDSVTNFKTIPLQLVKKLYKVNNTNSGEQLEEVTNENQLKVGDKIRVRMEIRCDRPMEYMHLKDLRASGFEPVDVISGYHYQGGLGYYQSTKDASTNFFIAYMPRGTYVFEYTLLVNNAGNYSNGITTLQNMYAPEFSTHSNGIRITTK